MNVLQLGSALILVLSFRQAHGSQWCIEVSPDIHHAPYKCPSFLSETSTSSKYNRVENYLSVGASYVVGYQGSLVLLGVETLTFLGARTIYYLVEVVEWLWNAIKSVFNWVYKKAFISFADWWYVEAWSRTIGALARSIGNSFWKGVGCVILIGPAFCVFCLWALVGAVIIVIGCIIGSLPIPFLFLVIPIAAVIIAGLGILSIVPLLPLIAIVALLSIVSFLIYMVLAIGFLQMVIIGCAIALCFMALALASSTLVGVMGCALGVDKRIPQAPSEIVSSQGCCSRISIIDWLSLVLAWFVNYFFQVLVFFSDLVVVHWSLQAMFSDRGLDVATLPRGLDMDIAIDIENSLGHFKSTRELIGSALEFTKVTFRNAIDLPEFIADWFDFQCSSMVATYTSSYVLAGWFFLFGLEGLCLKQKLADYYTAFQDLRVSRIFAKPCLYLFLRILELILSCASTAFFWFITRRHKQSCDYVSDWAMTILTHYILFGGSLLGMIVLAPRILLGTSSSGAYQSFAKHQPKVGDFWNDNANVNDAQKSNKSDTAVDRHWLMEIVEILGIILLSPFVICYLILSFVGQLISNPCELLRQFFEEAYALFSGSGSLVSEHVSLYLLFFGVWTQRTFALAGRKDGFWKPKDTKRTEEFCVISAKCAGAALFLFPCGPLLARLMENTNKGWVVRRRWNDGELNEEKAKMKTVFGKAKERMAEFVREYRKLQARETKLKEYEEMLEELRKKMKTHWEEFNTIYENLAEYDDLKPSMEILKNKMVELKEEKAQIYERKEKPMETDMLVWEPVETVGEDRRNVGTDGETCQSPKDRAVVVWNGCFYFLGASTQFDVHYYDTRDRKWTRPPDVSGDAPTARSSYTSVVCGDSIFIFGGTKESVQGEWYEGGTHIGSIQGTKLTLHTGDNDSSEDEIDKDENSEKGDSVHEDEGGGEMTRVRTQRAGQTTGQSGIERAIKMKTAQSFECKLGAAVLQADGNLHWTSGEFESRIWKRSGAGLDELFEFRIPCSHWTQIDSSTKPSPRFDHSCVVYDGDLYVHGGTSNKQEFLQDLHKFAVKPRRKQVMGKEGVMEVVEEVVRKSPTWKELETAEVPRSGHTAVVYEDAMFTFGGMNGSQLVDSLHEYGFSTNTWSSVVFEGVSPSRYFHSAVVFGSRMFVFGGVRDKECQQADQLSVGDGVKVKTTFKAKAKAKGKAQAKAKNKGKGKGKGIAKVGEVDVPEGAFGKVIEVDKDGNAQVDFDTIGEKLVTKDNFPKLFKQECLADICPFDFNMKSWVEETIGSENQPSARACHKSVMYGGRMYTWGGLGSTREQLPDMHRIALREQHSKKKKATSEPSQRVNGDAEREESPDASISAGRDQVLGTTDNRTSESAEDVEEAHLRKSGNAPDVPPSETSEIPAADSIEEVGEVSLAVNENEGFKGLGKFVGNLLGPSRETNEEKKPSTESTANTEKAVDDDERLKTIVKLMSVMSDSEVYLQALEKNEGLGLTASIDDVWKKGDPLRLRYSQLKPLEGELEFDEFCLVYSELKKAKNKKEIKVVMDKAEFELMNEAALYREKSNNWQEKLKVKKAALNLEKAEMERDAKEDMRKYCDDVESIRKVMFSATNENDPYYETPEKNIWSIFEKLFAVLKFLVMAIVPWITDQKLEVFFSDENSLRALTIRLGVAFLTLENLASIPKLIGIYQPLSGDNAAYSSSGTKGLDLFKKKSFTDDANRGMTCNKEDANYNIADEEDLRRFYLDIVNLYKQANNPGDEESVASSDSFKISIAESLEALQTKEGPTSVSVSQAGTVVRV